MARSIPRAFLAWLLFAAVFAALPSVPPANAQIQDQPKMVLVLYSSRRDGQFSKTGESDLPRLLDEGLGRNLDYYSEFIDRARIPDPSYRTAFRDYLRVKYGGIRFDLVIALQDTAAGFVRDNRDGLFPGIPVVFLSNDPGWRRIANATGLINPRNFTALLAFLGQLQPDVKNLFIVTGAGPSDKEYEAVVGGQMRRSGTGLNVIYLSGLATQTLRERLSRLPEHSAVYYILVNRDGAGNNYHPLEYTDRIAAAANAPTYSWADSTMGHGILGGNLYVQKDVIARVAELALRVLKGEKPDTIAVSIYDATQPQLDWRQLRRWGISESQIPAGTLVRFRNPTIWEGYAPFIIVVIAAFLTQSLLIAGLLVQRRRRRRAEEYLQDNRRALQKSYDNIRDLGGRLLQAQETERSLIATELHDDVCQRMLLLTIELKSLKKDDPSAGPADEALAMAQDISRSLHELSHRLHPARLRLIGLVASLDQLCREVSHAGLAVEFTHQDVPPALPADVMLGLFRIAQEALGNAIKYSGATKVSVRLTKRPAMLILEIADNGRGFDVEAVPSKGLGLMSMVERSETIGGYIDIQSRPGAGVTVTVRIPSPYRAAASSDLAV